MKAVFIGKGLYRITVRSKHKRERLSKIPEIRVEGNRVVFPEWLSGSVEHIINPRRRKRVSRPTQMSLFKE